MPAELCLRLKQSGLQVSAPKCPIGNLHQGGQNHVKSCVCVYALYCWPFNLKVPLPFAKPNRHMLATIFSWNARSNAVPSKKAWPMLKACSKAATGKVPNVDCGDGQLAQRICHSVPVAFDCPPNNTLPVVRVWRCWQRQLYTCCIKSTTHLLLPFLSTGTFRLSKKRAKGWENSW